MSSATPSGDLTITDEYVNKQFNKWRTEARRNSIRAWRHATRKEMIDRIIWTVPLFTVAVIYAIGGSIANWFDDRRHKKSEL